MSGSWDAHKRCVVADTPDGVLIWEPGSRPWGAQPALDKLARPREGSFGCVPGVPAEAAHWRKDSFMHLVRTIWPNANVIRDDVPDEPDSGPGIVH